MNTDKSKNLCLSINPSMFICGQIRFLLAGSGFKLLVGADFHDAFDDEGDDS